MSYHQKRTGLGETPASLVGTTKTGESCIQVCPKKDTIWTHLDKIGTIATTIGALGVIYAFMKERKYDKGI